MKKGEFGEYRRLIRRLQALGRALDRKVEPSPELLRKINEICKSPLTRLIGGNLVETNGK